MFVKQIHHVHLFYLVDTEGSSTLQEHNDVKF